MPSRLARRPIKNEPKKVGAAGRRKDFGRRMISGVCGMALVIETQRVIPTASERQAPRNCVNQISASGRCRYKLQLRLIVALFYPFDITH